MAELVIWKEDPDGGGYLFGPLGADYDPSREVIVIVHGKNRSGYLSVNDCAWIKEMAGAFHAKKENANILAWDWEQRNKIGNIVVEANGLALRLEERARIQEAPSTGLVGHSWGAKVVTFAAERLLRNEQVSPETMKAVLLDAWETLPLTREIGLRAPEAVEITASVERLARLGVTVENYPSRNGIPYDSAVNFMLKELTEQPTLAGSSEAHSFAHAWYAATINPTISTFPPSDTEDGALLLKYVPTWMSLMDFWKGVGDVGFNLKPGNCAKGDEWVPNPFRLPPYTVPGMFHPFSFRKEGSAEPLAGPTYSPVLIDDFSQTGPWLVNGTAYIQGREMHILTESPTFLLERIVIPFDADALRFDYRFINGVESNVLLFYIDDTLCWETPGLPGDDDSFYDSGWIGVGPFAGQEARLCFVLNDSADGQAHAVLRMLTFAQRIEAEYEAILVADAGDDQTVAVGQNCTAAVTLDGSRSTHSKNRELTYIKCVGNSAARYGPLTYLFAVILPRSRFQRISVAI